MAKAKDTTKRTYEVRSPIEHDLERYEIGESIELDEAAAAPLMACGAIAVPPAKAADKK